MTNHKLYEMKFSKLYPLYVAKAKRKGRSKDEVDQIIAWLTGYSLDELNKCIEGDINVESFFNMAPMLNSHRKLITGVICGVRVEGIKEELMQEIRYLDKLIDELGKGKKMEKILRSNN